jgi:hypothetical protein
LLAPGGLFRESLHFEGLLSFQFLLSRQFLRAGSGQGLFLGRLGRDVFLGAGPEHKQACQNK